MGVPPVTRLLLVSHDGAFREQVIDAVGHCADITLTVVETPSDAGSQLATTPVDCLLLDTHTAGQPVVEFRARLRADYPTLPIVVAAETTRPLPAALSVHAVIEKADPVVLPEVLRVLTRTDRNTRSPAVSAEQS